MSAKQQYLLIETQLNPRTSEQWVHVYSSPNVGFLKAAGLYYEIVCDLLLLKSKRFWSQGLSWLSLRFFGVETPATARKPLAKQTGSQAARKKGIYFPGSKED